MNIWQLILLQAVTFTAIVFFLKRLLQGQISRAVKRLQKLNEQNMQKEKMLKEEIARAKKETEAEIERGKDEAESIREEARDEAEKTKEAILDKSREEAKRVVDEATKDIRRKESELLSITQPFKDAWNIQAVILIHKESGLPMYSEELTIMEDEDGSTLLSGFVQAITAFSEKFIEREFRDYEFKWRCC